jgi:outer membrane protein OmpA-like peptidoglycan-associated protein
MLSLLASSPVPLPERPGRPAFLTRKENKMKNRIFVALLLSTALALPVFAQSNSSSSGQPADSANQSAAPSPGMTATGKEPLAQKSHDFWDGDEPGLGWLILHPFASKGNVQRHLQATQDRVSELDGLTASNSQMIRDVDGRAQQGIQLASTRVKEADEHALDASNKAQMAQQTASTASTRLPTVETVVGNIDQYKAATQTVIRFRAGQSVLSKQAKEALDQMAVGLKEQHGYVLEVQGFSASRGQVGIAASRQMADSVVRYLVLNHEIPAYRVYVVGMGNAPGAAEDGAMPKPTRGNRVEISLLKNGLDQLAAGSSTQQK